MKKIKDNIVLLSHGGGGLRTRRLIEDIMLRHLGNPILEQMDDGACISMQEHDLVFTTDSYVVSPPFFPGGNIGTLAACGTVNDLAMQGAEPKYLSFGLILQEGFAISGLDRIVESLAASCARAGALVVAGDTKVIERNGKKGTSDIFINTSGIGAQLAGVNVHVSNAQPGDAVIITGHVGDHGVAVLSGRDKGFGLQTGIASDVAPLWELIGPLLRSVPGIHCLRDPTRGGVAAALCDMAERSKVRIRIRQADLPVRKEVRGACDLLGLDPLNVANEGKALVLCSRAGAKKALASLRSHPLGKDAAIIGVVEPASRGMVVLETGLGGERIVEPPLGEDLPRIC